MHRGVAWLLNEQAKGGGWHSETYGALRQGSATTALVMYALSHLHSNFVDKKVNDALARGYQFLTPGIKKRGFIAAPDGSLDYPTYGTAMLATPYSLIRKATAKRSERRSPTRGASGLLSIHIHIRIAATGFAGELAHELFAFVDGRTFAELDAMNGRAPLGHIAQAFELPHGNEGIAAVGQ